MEEATYIYALTDPRTEEVRYIGKTINEPLDRLESHINDAQVGGRSYKNSWIKSLLSLGLEPDLSVLEIVFYPESWQERERWWIAFARGQEFRLTNLCSGGEGHPGHSPTPETRAKISKSNSGKVKSEEHRRKLSEANIGKTLSEETKQKIREASTGRKLSKEARQKISESNRRRTVSNETRQKMSKSSAGRVTSEETKLKISIAMKGRTFSEEHRRKIGEANRRRIVSLDTRQKISRANLGRKLGPMSEEHKRKISVANAGKTHSEETIQKISKSRGRPYPAFTHIKTGRIILAGNGLTAMCGEWGLNPVGMSAVKCGRQRSHKGWVLLEEKE